MQPDVSLSRRCTIPGRSTPPIEARRPWQWWSSALTRVPVRFPAAGWTTRPVDLLSTSNSSSSKRISRGISSGWRLGQTGSGMIRRSDRPGQRLFRLRGIPVEVHRTLTDQRLQPGSREVGRLLGKKAVEALATLRVLGDCKFHRFLRRIAFGHDFGSLIQPSAIFLVDAGPD